MEKGLTPAALAAASNGDLENFIAAATPGGIEAQEARGQQTFVNSETLPKNMLGCTQKDLESMGITFGDDADDIFVNVVLPEGWEKKATDHSMHSDLTDNKGRKRASIFYKAAFYDRSAHISLARRFGYSCSPEDQYKTNQDYDERKNGNWHGVVEDFGKIIFKSEPIKKPSFDQRDELQATAKKWVDSKYPDHENKLAYWD